MAKIAPLSNSLNPITNLPSEDKRTKIGPLPNEKFLGPANVGIQKQPYMERMERYGKDIYNLPTEVGQGTLSTYQPGSEIAGNALAQFSANALSSAATYFPYAIELISEWSEKGKSLDEAAQQAVLNSQDNGFIQKMNALRDSAAINYPIHMDKEGRETLFTKDEWWGNMVAQFGTSVGIMAPTAAVAALTEGAGLGAAGSLATILFGASSRLSESMMEADETYKNLYQHYSNLGLDSDMVSALAAKNAGAVVTSNMKLAFLDAFQTALALGSVTKLGQAITKSALGTFLTSAPVKYGLATGTEAGEEGYQFYLQKEAEFEMAKDLGAKYLESASQRMNSYFKDVEFWNAVILGAAGGAVFQAGGEIYDKIDKRLKKDKDKLDAAKDFINDLNENHNKIISDYYKHMSEERLMKDLAENQIQFAASAVADEKSFNDFISKLDAKIADDTQNKLSDFPAKIKIAGVELTNGEYDNMLKKVITTAREKYNKILQDNAHLADMTEEQKLELSRNLILEQQASEISNRFGESISNLKNFDTSKVSSQLANLLKVKADLATVNKAIEVLKENKDGNKEYLKKLFNYKNGLEDAYTAAKESYGKVDKETKAKDAFNESEVYDSLLKRTDLEVESHVNKNKISNLQEKIKGLTTKNSVKEYKKKQEEALETAKQSEKDEIASRIDAASKSGNLNDIVNALTEEEVRDSENLSNEEKEAAINEAYKNQLEKERKEAGKINLNELTASSLLARYQSRGLLAINELNNKNTNLGSPEGLNIIANLFDTDEDIRKRVLEVLRSTIAAEYVTTETVPTIDDILQVEEEINEDDSTMQSIIPEDGSTDTYTDRMDLASNNDRASYVLIDNTLEVSGIEHNIVKIRIPAEHDYSKPYVFEHNGKTYKAYVSENKRHLPLYMKQGEEWVKPDHIGVIDLVDRDKINNVDEVLLSKIERGEAYIHYEVPNEGWNAGNDITPSNIQIYYYTVDATGKKTYWGQLKAFRAYTGDNSEARAASQHMMRLREELYKKWIQNNKKYDTYTDMRLASLKDKGLGLISRILPGRFNFTNQLHSPTNLKGAVNANGDFYLGIGAKESSKIMIYMNSAKIPKELYGKWANTALGAKAQNGRTYIFVKAPNGLYYAVPTFISKWNFLAGDVKESVKQHVTNVLTDLVNNKIDLKTAKFEIARYIPTKVSTTNNDLNKLFDFRVDEQDGVVGIRTKLVKVSSEGKVEGTYLNNIGENNPIASVEEVVEAMDKWMDNKVMNVSSKHINDQKYNKDLASKGILNVNLDPANPFVMVKHKLQIINSEAFQVFNGSSEELKVNNISITNEQARVKSNIDNIPEGVVKDAGNNQFYTLEADESVKLNRVSSQRKDSYDSALTSNEEERKEANLNNPHTARGTLTDDILRAIINGHIKTLEEVKNFYSNHPLKDVAHKLSEESLKNIFKIFSDLVRLANSKNAYLSTVNKILYGYIKSNSTSAIIKAAGKLDFAIIGESGSQMIIDLKTSINFRNKQSLEQDAVQLSDYAQLFAQRTGNKPLKGGILALKFNYSKDGKTVESIEVQREYNEDNVASLMNGLGIDLKNNTPIFREKLTAYSQTKEPKGISQEQKELMDRIIAKAEKDAAAMFINVDFREDLYSPTNVLTEEQIKKGVKEPSHVIESLLPIKPKTGVQPRTMTPVGSGNIVPSQEGFSEKSLQDIANPQPAKEETKEVLPESTVGNLHKKEGKIRTLMTMPLGGIKTETKKESKPAKPEIEFFPVESAPTQDTLEQPATAEKVNEQAQELVDGVYESEAEKAEVELALQSSGDNIKDVIAYAVTGAYENLKANINKRIKKQESRLKEIARLYGKKVAEVAKRAILTATIVLTIFSGTLNHLSDFKRYNSDVYTVYDDVKVIQGSALNLSEEQLEEVTAFAKSNFLTLEASVVAMVKLYENGTLDTPLALSLFERFGEKLKSNFVFNIKNAAQPIKYRKAEGEFIEMDLEKELKFLRKIFPFYKAEELYTVLETLEGVAEKGVSAWGVYKNNMIYLLNNGSRGTAYWEGFRKIFNEFLHPRERSILLQYAMDQNKTSFDNETFLAQEFSDFISDIEYANFLKKSYKKLYYSFKRLLAMAKALVGIESKRSLDEIFYDLAYAKASYVTPNYSNSLVDESKYRLVFNPEEMKFITSLINNIFVSTIDYLRNSSKEYSQMTDSQIINSLEGYADNAKTVKIYGLNALFAGAEFNGEQISIYGQISKLADDLKENGRIDLATALNRFLGQPILDNYEGNSVLTEHGIFKFKYIKNGEGKYDSTGDIIGYGKLYNYLVRNLKNHGYDIRIKRINSIIDENTIIGIEDELDVEELNDLSGTDPMDAAEALVSANEDMVDEQESELDANAYLNEDNVGESKLLEKEAIKDDPTNNVSIYLRREFAKIVKPFAGKRSRLYGEEGFNFQEHYEPSEIIQPLLEHITSSYDVEDMMNKLDAMDREIYPFVDTLINRINEDDFFKSQMFKVAQLQYVNYYFSYTTQAQKTTLLNANIDRLVETIVRNWSAGFSALTLVNLETGQSEITDKGKEILKRSLETIKEAKKNFNSIHDDPTYAKHGSTTVHGSKGDLIDPAVLLDEVIRPLANMFKEMGIGIDERILMAMYRTFNFRNSKVSAKDSFTNFIFASDENHRGWMYMIEQLHGGTNVFEVSTIETEQATSTHATNLRKLAGLVKTQFPSYHQTAHLNQDNEPVFNIIRPPKMMRALLLYKMADTGNKLVSFENTKFFSESPFYRVIREMANGRTTGEFKVEDLEIGLYSHDKQPGISKGKAFKNMHSHEFLKASMSAFANTNGRKALARYFTPILETSPVIGLFTFKKFSYLANAEPKDYMTVEENEMQLSTNSLDFMYQIARQEAIQIQEVKRLKKEIKDIAKGDKKLEETLGLKRLMSEVGTKFHFFKSPSHNGLYIYDEQTGERISLTPEQILNDNYKEVVYDALKTFTDDVLFENIKKASINAGIISENADGTLSTGENPFVTNLEVFNKDISIRQFLYDYATNTFIANTQIQTLFTGQPAAYGDGLNYFKRTKAEMWTPGLFGMNDSLNEDDKYSKVITVKDQELESSEEFKEAQYKVMKEAGYTKKQAEAQLKKFFKAHNTTDAFTIVSVDYVKKELLRRNGVITEEQKGAFKRIEEGKESIEDYNIVSVPNTKNYWGGFVEFFKGMQTTHNQKTMQVVVTPRMAETSPFLGKAYATLKNTKADMITFESSTKMEKVGVLSYEDYLAYSDKIEMSEPSIDLINPVNKELSVNVDGDKKIVGYALAFDNDNNRIIMGTPNHFLNSTNKTGIQFIKLMTADIMDEVRIDTGNGETMTMGQIKRELTKTFLEDILESKGEVYDEKKGIIGNVAKIVDMITEGKGKELPYDLLEALNQFVDEARTDTVIPLSDPLVSHQVEARVLSYLTDKFILHRSLGPSLFNIGNPQIGLDANLKVVRNKDKSIRYFEVNMPAHLKEMYDLYADENGIIDPNNTLIPEELQLGIMYRIPTEGKLSIIPFKVKNYTPIQNGGIVQLPIEITTIVGLDFDADKMFAIMYEYTVKTHDAGLFAEKVKGINPEIEYQKQILEPNGIIDKKKFAAKLRKEYGVPFSYSRREGWTYKTLEAVNSKENSKKGRANRRLDLWRAILSSKEGSSQIINTGGFDTLIEQANMYKKKMDTSFLNNSIADITTYFKMFELYQQGSQLIGIAANWNSFNAVIQNYIPTISLNPFKNKNTGELEERSIKVRKGGKLYELKTLGSMYVYGDKNQGFVSKAFREFIASTVDAAKDPVPYFLNLNTYTADVYGLLNSLGMSDEDAIAVMKQPEFVYISEKYFEYGGNKEAEKRIINEFVKDKDLETKIIMDSSDRKDFNMELNMDEVYSRAGEDLDLRDDYVKYFFYLKQLASQTSDVIRAFKVMEGRLGPSVGDFFAKQSIYEEGVRKDGKLLTGVKEFLQDTKGTYHHYTVQYSQAINSVYDTFKTDMPAFSPAFKNVLEFIDENMITSGSTLRPREINLLSSFLKTWIVSEFPLFKYGQDKYRYLLSNKDEEGNVIQSDFVAKFAKFKMEQISLGPAGKYQTMLKNISIDKPTDRVPFYTLNFVGLTGSNDTMRERFRRDWDEMLNSEVAEERQMGLDLMAYSFFRSGYNFTPKGFSMMQPYEAAVDVIVENEEGLNVNRRSIWVDYIQRLRENPTILREQADRFLISFIKHYYKILNFVPSITLDPSNASKNEVFDVMYSKTVKGLPDYVMIGAGMTSGKIKSKNWEEGDFLNVPFIKISVPIYRTIKEGRNAGQEYKFMTKTFLFQEVTGMANIKGHTIYKRVPALGLGTNAVEVSRTDGLNGSIFKNIAHENTSAPEQVNLEKWEFRMRTGVFSFQQGFKNVKAASEESGRLKPLERTLTVKEAEKIQTPMDEMLEATQDTLAAPAIGNPTKKEMIWAEIKDKFKNRRANEGNEELGDIFESLIDRYEVETGNIKTSLFNLDPRFTEEEFKWFKDKYSEYLGIKNNKVEESLEEQSTQDVLQPPATIDNDSINLFKKAFNFKNGEYGFTLHPDVFGLGLVKNNIDSLIPGLNKEDELLISLSGSNKLFIYQREENGKEEKKGELNLNDYSSKEGILGYYLIASNLFENARELTANTKTALFFMVDVHISNPTLAAYVKNSSTVVKQGDLEWKDLLSSIKSDDQYDVVIELQKKICK